MKSTFLSIFLVTSLLFTSCKMAESQKIEQGVRGQVLWHEGNMMPGAGKDAPAGQPVQREVVIYQVVNMADVKGSQSFYSKIPTPVVKKIQTNKKGEFSVSLPPGIYSIFVQEDQGLYANNFDSLGNINPVTITAEKVVDLIIDVNYKATY